MTTEHDFQAALDGHPDDWQTRLVFADWLDERGDPRADGYRALGVRRMEPKGTGVAWWMRYDPATVSYQMPSDWYAFLDVPYKDDHFAPSGRLIPPDFEYLRRAAEDAAALAFAKLPAQRRTELLATGVRS